MIAVSCGCGKTFQAKPEFAGRKVKCPQCHDPLRIPMSEKQKKKKSKPSSASKQSKMDALLDDVGIIKAGMPAVVPSAKNCCSTTLCCVSIADFTWKMAGSFRRSH